MKKTIVLSFAFLAAAVTLAYAAADETLPRAGSLKRDEVFVRAGPGMRYPILWVFKRQGWPVEVLAQYDNWYKIRDVEGEEGWVFRAMVSGRHTAVIGNGAEPASVFRKADARQVIMKMKPGVVVDFEECAPGLCRISYQGNEGWIERGRLQLIETAKASE